MLTLEVLEKVLNEYIDRYVPAMLRRGYHLLLAKGGREYPHLPEQSLFTHIINGVFGLARPIGDMAAIWAELHRLLKPQGILSIEGRLRPPERLFQFVKRQGKIAQFRKAE